MALPQLVGRLPAAALHGGVVELRSALQVGRRAVHAVLVQVACSAPPRTHARTHPRTHTPSLKLALCHGGRLSFVAELPGSPATRPRGHVPVSLGRLTQCMTLHASECALLGYDSFSLGRKPHQRIIQMNLTASQYKPAKQAIRDSHRLQKIRIAHLGLQHSKTIGTGGSQLPWDVAPRQAGLCASELESRHSQQSRYSRHFAWLEARCLKATEAVRRREVCARRTQRSGGARHESVSKRGEAHRGKSPRTPRPASRLGSESFWPAWGSWPPRGRAQSTSPAGTWTRRGAAPTPGGDKPHKVHKIDRQAGDA